MRIVVLSRGRSVFATNRLVAEADALGHVVRVVDPWSCTVLVGADGGVRSSTGRRIESDADVVIPRIGSGPEDAGLAVVEQLEQNGVPALNTADAISRARDKLTCLQALSARRVPVPRTALVRTSAQIGFAVEAVGGPPVMVKLRRGSGGVGVIRAHSIEDAEAVAGSVLSLGQAVLIQDVVGSEDGRSDLRVVVVRGKAIAAMTRTAQVGTFRANVRLGGRVRPVAIDGSLERAAVRAAEAVGLALAGVDLVPTAAGPPVVLEVNASPGFEGLERATGVNVARAALIAATETAREGRRSKS